MRIHLEVSASGISREKAIALVMFDAAGARKKPERHVERAEWSYVPLVRETSL